MSILLIDLSSLIVPLWHMSSREPDQDWTSNQAVARIRQLAESHQHTAICCDSRSFRKQVDPSYKANRPERDERLSHQVRVTRDRLVADGFPVWAADGFEADDVIASAVLALYEPGVEINIASADKDLLQLVGDGVTVHSTMNGHARFDEAAVRGKFGVSPGQMRDYLTLVGDASDNIKGVPSIGPKKAAELLSAFGTIDVLLDGLDTAQVHPSTKKALQEHRQTIENARALVTLKPEAEIDFQTIFQPRQSAAPIEDTMTEALATPPSIVEENQPEQAPSSDVTTKSDALVRPTVEVEPFTGAWERQLEPRNPADARTIAKWLHSSKLFSQYGSPEAVFSIVLAGRELGLGTMASLRGFHVVEGRPTMAADLMRALVLSSGKAEYFQCVERTATGSTWETRRKSDPAPTRLSYTLAEATAANLVRSGSGWTKHPADMIAKTASSKLCRLVYPDVTFGLYSTEELGGDE